MLYRTIHTTTYVYDRAVSQSISEAHLIPRATSSQRVLESAIHVDPHFAAQESRTDYFGNTVTTISVSGSHDRFTVTSTSLVENGLAEPAPDSSLAWEEARDALVGSPDPETIAAVEFTFDSPYAPMIPSVAEYTRVSFTPGRPLIDAVKETASRINSDFSYKPQSTAIGIPLDDLMDLRHGVCQDFAHVMISGLRSIGLAARYVSGYLRSGADVLGAEASHAWVSVYVPGAGWLDFDPTNNVRPREGHVTVGWGRDYGDVTPIRGITLGGGGQKVDVEVSVRPAA